MTKSMTATTDEDFGDIDIENGAKKAYPKYQWTIMFGTRQRSENITIREDNGEAFYKAREDALKLLKDEIKNEMDDDPIMTATAGMPDSSTSDSTTGGLTCSKCGSPAIYKTGTNKNGKFYKGTFCQNAQCGFVKWG